MPEGKSARLRREAQWAEREGGERGAVHAVQAYVCIRACPKARISEVSRLFGFDGGTRPVMCCGTWPVSHDRQVDT